MAHNILRTHIAAAIHTAADSDLRNYLNGVFVEHRIVVSTDGHVLSAYIGPECDEYLPPFIIPLDAAKLIARKSSSVVSCAALPDGRIDVGGVVFTPIVGVFPDFRRVIGEPTDELHDMQFNPELLAKFSKVAKALGSKGENQIPYIRAIKAGGGARIALAGRESEFIGVAMPMRYKASLPRPQCGTWINDFPNRP